MAHRGLDQVMGLLSPGSHCLCPSGVCTFVPSCTSLSTQSFLPLAHVGSAQTPQYQSPPGTPPMSSLQDGDWVEAGGQVTESTCVDVS